MNGVALRKLTGGPGHGGSRKGADKALARQGRSISEGTRFPRRRVGLVGGTIRSSLAFPRRTCHALASLAGGFVAGVRRRGRVDLPGSPARL